MGFIPAGVMVGWPGTAASIPSGWARESNLTLKFIRGAAAGDPADLTSTFGQATHTHTSPTHTPIQNSHVHVVSAGAGSGTVAISTGTPVVYSATGNHQHIAANSAATTATTQAASLSLSVANNLPLLSVVIWIKSDGTPTGLPSGCYAYFVSDTLPPGWTRVLGDAYLRGASSAGNGGGGATGGSNTHTHAEGHTHVQDAHLHGTINSGTETPLQGGKSGADVVTAALSHRHSYSLDTTTADDNQSVVTISTESHEPPYKKINTVSNDTGGDSLPDGIVAIWGGTNASIPASWTRLVAMDDYFPKGAAVDGESGVTTGGAASHSHTSGNCQPTQQAHNHTFLIGSITTTANLTSGAVNVSASTHVHHVWSVADATATYSPVATSVDANTSESAYPSHAKVIFIQYHDPSRFFLVLP